MAGERGIPAAYFDVFLVGPFGPINGTFLSVSGLSMEVAYEIYNEGGSNYPRYFFKNVKPQTLVLERGVLSDYDNATLIMGMVNLGCTAPMEGAIIMRDMHGNAIREWTVVGAHFQKYEGPALNSNQAAVAVNRIELVHNGVY